MFTSSRSKRLKMSPSSSSSAAATASGGQHHHEPLLPGLPDHLAQLALDSLPPPLLFAVSRSWRRLLYSPSFPPFLSLYAVLSSLSSPDTCPPRIELASFDPISNKWSPLPSLPLLPSPILLSHPSFLSRPLPVQSSSVAGHLAVVSATTSGLTPALSGPLIFDPAAAQWKLGPAFTSPRRWCAVGSAAGSLYVASGVGSDYSSDIARSMERLDLNRIGSGWESLNPLRDGRFSREPIQMVASNGKLCMVNCRGPGPKEGILYDIGSGMWEEMPVGLLTGWTGPAAVVEEGGTVYAVDEGSGSLRRYDWEDDTWTAMMESERLKGAVGIAGGGGRVCVTCGGGEAVAVVDVKRKNNAWTVLPPEGRRVIALHVLPRMSRDES